MQNENENQNENADEVASEAGSMDSAGKEPGSSEALHEQHRSSSDAPESLSSGDRSQRSRRREESVSGIAAGLESGGDESSDDEEADIEMGTLVPSGYRPVGKEEDALCTWSLADIDLDADLGTFSSGTFGEFCSRARVCCVTWKVPVDIAFRPHCHCYLGCPFSFPRPSAVFFPCLFPM